MFEDQDSALVYIFLIIRWSQTHGTHQCAKKKNTRMQTNIGHNTYQSSI